MTTALDVEQEIRAFLARKAPHQREAVQALTRTDVIWGNVDSLLVLGLVTHLEKTFAVKFSPKDFTPENLGTIERLVAFVGHATQASKPAST